MPISLVVAAMDHLLDVAPSYCSDSWFLKQLFSAFPPNMPPPTVTQNRLDNVVTGLTMTTNTLEIIADSIQTPFLGAIINTTQAVLNNIQVSFLEDTYINVKLNHS
jgi:hypothetical protein